MRVDDQASTVESGAFEAALRRRSRNEDAVVQRARPDDKLPLRGGPEPCRAHQAQGHPVAAQGRAQPPGTGSRSRSTCRSESRPGQRKRAASLLSAHPFSVTHR